MILSYEKAMLMAINKASSFRGATFPNPPVGAVGMDITGRLLEVAAHEKPGEFHAERNLFEKCIKNGSFERLHTIVVTLEPCSTLGKTPPCTESIADSNVRRVVIGTTDPNPIHHKKGIERLKELGIEVITGVLQEQCEKLIEPFSHWVNFRRPWLTLKTALNESLSMIPTQGQKTFTSRDSLRFAHELRKRSGAIITGSGTILSDHPLFNVRYIPDHADTKRVLVILDRRNRISNEYIENAQKRGFEVVTGLSLTESIDYLGSIGIQDALIEAGPTLTHSVLELGLWDEHAIIQKRGNGIPDQIEMRRKDALQVSPLRTNIKTVIAEQSEQIQLAQKSV